MRHLMKQRTTLIVVFILVPTMVFSTIALGGIATSPLGFKPLARLSSCPLGIVSQALTR